jgi:hypothetical protein
MRDPHVTTLHYRLETDGSTTYHGPPPVVLDTPEWSLNLDTDHVTVTMIHHFATVELARAEVEPLLRAWELDVELRVGPGELHLAFEDANVIDRDPPQEHSRVMELSAALIGVTGMSTKLSVRRRSYHPPPKHFHASPDVETMYSRYQGYRKGREPLLSRPISASHFWRSGRAAGRRPHVNFI